MVILVIHRSSWLVLAHMAHICMHAYSPHKLQVMSILSCMIRPVAHGATAFATYRVIALYSERLALLAGRRLPAKTTSCTSIQLEEGGGDSADEQGREYAHDDNGCGARSSVSLPDLELTQLASAKYSAYEDCPSSQLPPEQLLLWGHTIEPIRFVVTDR